MKNNLTIVSFQLVFSLKVVIHSLKNSLVTTPTFICKIYQWEGLLKQPHENKGSPLYMVSKFNNWGLLNEYYSQKICPEW